MACEPLSVRVLIWFVMYGRVSFSWLAVYFHISPLTLEVLGGCVPAGGLIDEKSLARTTPLTIKEQEGGRRRSWRLILQQQVAAGIKWTETRTGLWLTCVSVWDKWAVQRSLTPLTLPGLGGGEGMPTSARTKTKTKACLGREKIPQIPQIILCYTTINKVCRHLCL